MFAFKMKAFTFENLEVSQQQISSALTLSHTFACCHYAQVWVGTDSIVYKNKGELSLLFSADWNQNNLYDTHSGAIFVWPWKMISVSVRYLFYQAIDERSKHGLFVFPPKKTLIWRRHCSICQSCCSMTSKRSVDWFLQSSSGMTFFHLNVRLTNQKPRAFVSVRQTNQVALFPLVCCFCFVRAFSFQGHTKIARLLEIPIDYCFELLTILC